MRKRTVRMTLIGAALAAAAMAPSAAGAAGWSPAITPLGTKDVVGIPALAVNASGDAVVAASGTSGTVAATRTDDGAFSLPVVLSRHGHDPQAAINGAGDAVVAWFEADAVHFAVRPHGGPYGPVHDVPSVSGSEVVDAVRVGIDDDGDVGLGWYAYSGATTVLRVARFTPDGELLDSGSSDPAKRAGAYFDLAMSRDGTVVAAYSEKDGNGMGTPMAGRLAPGEAFDTAPLGPSEPWAMPHLDVAIDAAGRAVVAFERTVSGVSTDVLAAFGRVDGPLSPAVVVSTPGGHSFRPDVALGDGGDVAFTWTEPYTMTARARLGRFDEPFTAPIQAFATGSGRPSVAVAPDGKAVATWGAFVDGPASLVSAVREPGGTFAEQPPIGPGPSGSIALDQPGTPVGIDAEGHAFAAWIDESHLRLATDEVGAPWLTAVPVADPPRDEPAPDPADDPTTPTGDGAPGDGAPGDGAPGDGAGTPTGQPRTTGAGDAAPGGTPRSVVAAAPKPAAKPAAVRCRVPQLAGLSYARASAKLRSAHCSVGGATKPKGRRTTKGLVVTGQSRKAGSLTKAGARVDVALRVKKAAARRHGQRK